MPNKYKLTTHSEYMRSLPADQQRRIKQGAEKLIAQHDRELARKRFWRSLLTVPLKLLGRVGDRLLAWLKSVRLGRVALK